MISIFTGIHIGPRQLEFPPNRLFLIRPAHSPAIFLAIEIEESGWSAMVVLRNGANTVGREKFIFVQHVFQHAPQLSSSNQAQNQSIAGARSNRWSGTVNKIRAMLDEPLPAILKRQDIASKVSAGMVVAPNIGTNPTIVRARILMGS